MRSISNNTERAIFAAAFVSRFWRYYEFESEEKAADLATTDAENTLTAYVRENTRRKRI